MCNLGVFGLLSALSDGRWKQFGAKAKWAAGISLGLVLLAPIAISEYRFATFQEDEEPLEVLIAQPNFDPYQKFQSLTQAQQNAILEGQVVGELRGRKDSTSLLVLAPETFTWDVTVGEVDSSATVKRFVRMLRSCPGANFRLNASRKLFSSISLSSTSVLFAFGAFFGLFSASLISPGPFFTLLIPLYPNLSNSPQ